MIRGCLKKSRQFQRQDTSSSTSTWAEGASQPSSPSRKVTSPGVTLELASSDTTGWPDTSSSHRMAQPSAVAIVQVATQEVAAQDMAQEEPAMLAIDGSSRQWLAQPLAVASVQVAAQKVAAQSVAQEEPATLATYGLRPAGPLVGVQPLLATPSEHLLMQVRPAMSSLTEPTAPSISVLATPTAGASSRAPDSVEEGVAIPPSFPPPAETLPR